MDHSLRPGAKDETEIQRSDRGMLINIRLLAEAHVLRSASSKEDTHCFRYESSESLREDKPAN